ncbi:putative phosphotransferase [Pseudonocardia sp. Ae168_Ps1]|uniref:phosphotransferase family protein n=1 Tax=unclassified Pseudonocardia TaxID=2619320 RepID=UPI00094AB396|nr:MULTISPECIES: phosphotransferase family protein [unclassified Pseudonocardia]OLL73703.1 putative phosphotransferase [Pseudonocardia sp. Ae150A_Ps1]OLL79681.1 putative phosphotransferase [Pseudonocardia sp. Ae168_Ps1]OLL86183.1 putative phosphotransferase [Pseudonocardia sp. Ae263_Ps1]OLL93786.1 putative phosphotransferase [Pseudonocardia sp. Ae356_Ps1]
MTRSIPATDADAELTARVRSALDAPGAGPMSVLEGGRSGLTYVLRHGDAGVVVKAVPPGRRAIGRHDVLHQATALAALAVRGLPLPRVLARDEAEPAWFAMEFAAGEAVEPVLTVDTEIDPVLARTRMLAAARILGALHAVPTAELDAAVTALGAAPPVPAGPGEELARWTRTMRAVPDELRPGSEELLAALAASVPAAVAPTVVHGDFRLGNLLFDGTTPTALVDWEIWGVGDPRGDLAWFGVFTDGRLFPGSGREVAGLPTEEELGREYRAARGDDGGTEQDLAWFRAVGRMKMAAIMGHNLVRHRTGAHHDPVQEQLPPAIAAMIRDARLLLDGGDAG